jgi:hypothetical protein
MSTTLDTKMLRCARQTAFFRPCLYIRICYCCHQLKGNLTLTHKHLFVSTWKSYLLFEINKPFVWQSQLYAAVCAFGAEKVNYLIRSQPYQILSLLKISQTPIFCMCTSVHEFRPLQIYWVSNIYKVIFIMHARSNHCTFFFIQDIPARLIILLLQTLSVCKHWVP